MTIDFKKLEKKTGIKMNLWERNVISSLNDAGVGTMRPVSESGHFSHTRYIDHTTDIENACVAIGAKYSVDNDAPRGGKLGDFITITLDRRGKIWRALKSEN